MSTSFGGDFNMSVFSTVGDVVSDAEFSAPGNSFLWGLGALEEPIRECAGFLIMPKRLYEWRVHSHGCHKFDIATFGLGPRDQTAHLPVFLHLRTTYCHLRENDYSFDALQTYCFRINVKL